MGSGGRPTAGPGHGRHRRGWVNSAWTPAVRPTEPGHLPAHARICWATPLPAEGTSVRTPQESEAADADADTPPQGLRKFDLGIVPASVTPPRSWRRAAWFAVGTSAAVVCGLAVAAVRLVGAPAGDTIDALPAFPTQELGTLPIDETAPPPRTAHTSSSRSPSRPRPDTARRTNDAPPPGPPGTSRPGSAGGHPTTGPADTVTRPAPPARTTVGPAPLTPTNPEEMGDRTERYFALVTDDPATAHEMCTGGMESEGPEGIAARYAGVERIEVRAITIDRNHALTTSTVKIVHDDGTETVVQRRLTFTWGGDPKISDDTAAS